MPAPRMTVSFGDVGVKRLEAITSALQSVGNVGLVTISNAAVVTRALELLCVDLGIPTDPATKEGREDVKMVRLDADAMRRIEAIKEEWRASTGDILSPSTESIVSTSLILRLREVGAPDPVLKEVRRHRAKEGER